MRSPAATRRGANGSAGSSTGPAAFAEPQALIEEVELIILAVPDDAIDPIARELRMYSGQAMVHTERRARRRGPGAGAWPPGPRSARSIRSSRFADTERAVAALRGATVAIEGDDQLAALLAEMAEGLGRPAVRLAPGSKAAYHAAAVLAAGGFVALLDAIAELGRRRRLDEAGALAVYGPLIEGTLGNARALGIAAALTGPMTRGDVGTLRAHLDALAAHAPGAADCTWRPRPPGDRARHGPWRAGTGDRVGDARSALDGACKAGLTSTIAPDGTQHRRQVRGTAGGPIRRARRAGRGSDDWASAPSRLVLGRPSARPCCAARGRALRAPSGGLARTTAVAGGRSDGRPRPAVQMHWARSGRTGAGRRPSAAAAPWHA